jgi:hypothetical protein
MATKIETIETPNYTFEIWRESSRSWYANAKPRGDDVWFYKWTTAKTKKAVISYIESFAF